MHRDHVTIFNAKVGEKRLIDGDNWESTFLDMNGTPYRFTRGQDKHVDFILGVVNPFSDIIKPRRLLMLDIFNNDAYQCDRIKRHLDAEPNLIWITNAWDPGVVHERLYCVDVVFNRTKAYYTQFPFRSGVKPWYYDSRHAYVNCELTAGEQRQKIFLSPNKTHRGGRPRRVMMREFMKEFSALGYTSNADDSNYNFLYSQAEWPWDDMSIQDIERRHLENVPAEHREFWNSPPHNAYYLNTFLSIYVETIERGTTLAVTEKTYEPLMKGHFILPFSAPGYINRLRNIGVELPDFINYEYDLITDDDQRWQSYCDEIRRLLSMPIQKWRELWDSNLELIYRNKLMFHVRDYQRIDLFKLLDFNF